MSRDCTTIEMTPPTRRGGGAGGGEGRGGKSGGRGRGRGGGGGAGGGGRGGRGGGGGASAAEPSSAQPPVAPSPGEGGRTAKAKGDKSKLNRKVGNAGSGGKGANGASGGGAQTSRPARTVSVITRKVQVRNIPYDWDEEKLVELVEAHGAARQHVWRFVAGKVRSNNRAPRPGRVYLDFKKDAELAKRVIDELNGYAVPDSKDQVRLDVEFAPFQKVPREKQRKDAKVGTIDRDPEFIAFLEELAKPQEKLPSADAAAESKDTESLEKPVAALVQYLNERKRDKKGKFAGKATDKSRNSRAKSAKEGKGSKEKGKGSKSKSKASADAASAKDTAKPRKARGKNAKDKSGDSAQVEPGAVKIMGAKSHESTAAGSDTASHSTITAESAPPKAKSGGGKGGKGQRKQQGPKETSSEASAAEAAPAKDGKAGGGRGRRDSRASKGPKPGGRGDPLPKKVFAPKATTPAG